jgi:hypothetical protein
MRQFLLLIALVGVGHVTFAQNKGSDSLIRKRQQANLAYTSLYKENSEMSYTSPFGELGAPTGNVINGKLTTTYLLFGPSTLPIAFSVNPDFTVRVKNDRSAGVRTPSFRLGGTFYLRLAPDEKQYRYAALGFTHHSNGQDGDALLPDGNINTLTGNFSTNYLTATYSFGHFNKASFTGISSSYNHKVGLEWHKWFAYEKALNGDYGFTRLKYDFSYRIYQNYERKSKGWKPAHGNQIANEQLQKERWRFNAECTYAVNRLDFYGILAPKKRLNAEVSANYSLPFMQNVFLMASFGYYEEDPYNIYFKDRYAYARFGLSSTFSRYKIN